MKVLHIGPDPESVGGMASVIRRYVQSGQDLEHLNFVSWAPGDSALGSVWRLRRLPSRLRAIGPAVVHLHLSERGSFLREGVIAALMARFFKVPVAATLHGADYFAEGKLPALARIALGIARAVAVLGPETREGLLDSGVRVPIVVMANPAPTDPEVADIMSHEIDDVNAVFFAGEVGTRKGVDRLLRAWPEVLKQRPTARLQIAGPFGDVQELPAIEGISYLGVLSSADVLSYLSRCRVAVLPSRREVLPMFVIEALSLGRPVVYGRAGEWRAFADCSAVAVVDEVDDLVERVVEVLSKRDFDYQELRRSAKSWVLRNAEPDVIQARLAELYSHASSG